MPKKILVIDDEPMVIRMATDGLTARGFTVVSAPNGYEGLIAARGEKSDLILLDIEMPVMDGLEATRLIREYEQHSGKPPVRIIGITAHALASDRKRCLAAGMDDYISKPFDCDTLRQKLALAGGAA